MTRVLGADAAGRFGWVAVLLEDGRFVAAAAGSLADLAKAHEPLDAVGVDIPIGLIAGRGRRADVEARRFIGGRGSSVFSAPAREALDASTYLEANEALVAAGSSRISKQAWALMPKIAEAAAVATVDRRVFEVHPELSFRVMAGRPLEHSKKSWNGIRQRIGLLAQAGIDLPTHIEGIGGVGTDDVVDAAAVAWSATRIALGTARSFPDPPEEVDGRPVAIWC